MADLFEREQKILDRATLHLKEVHSGVNCNADEYATLVKEYGRLLRQLRRVVRLSDKTTIDLNMSKLDLLDKVHYDALTGIYNRRFLEESLKNIIKSVAQTEGILSVLIMDIDYFKRYNDTYGHSTGDDCLRMIAQALNESILREEDFVARYGGEEFVAVLPNTDGDTAYEVANRILENVRKCNIPHEKNDAADCVTISIGITTGAVEKGCCPEDYIKRADQALYQSKQKGRNTGTFLNLKEVHP